MRRQVLDVELVEVRRGMAKSDSVRKAVEFKGDRGEVGTLFSVV